MGSARELLVQQLKSVGVLREDVRTSELLEASEQPILYLSQRALLSEGEALLALSNKFGFPLFHLGEPSVESKLSWAEFQEDGCPSFFAKHQVLPLWRENGELLVAFANPFDHELQQALEFKFSSRIKVAIGAEELISRLLERYYPLQDTAVHADDSEEVQELELVAIEDESDDFYAEDSEAPPVIRLCNRILADALEERASDIHIEPSAKRLDVRYRVDGAMRDVLEIPARLSADITSRLKLISGMNIAERRKPQDGRFRIRLSKKKVDVRASVIPTAHGEKIVLRLLSNDMRRVQLSSLGLSDETRNSLHNLLSKKDKLLLVTGPTGSGKTTSLYSFINHLNDGSRNIETVEDPIEYQLPRINQVQVNESIGVSFASCLRSILRQDPDVVMVGEIRDAETARISLQAAETGHLVLSTLHTNDAPSAVVRLQNLGLKPYQIASAIGGVLAQRLVRRLCNSCSRELSPAEQSEFEEKYLLRSGTLDGARTADGCEHCKGTGFYDRIGIYSLLSFNTELRQAVLEGKSSEQLAHIARNSGYRSLAQEALRVCQEGFTCPQEVGSFIRELTVEENAEFELKSFEALDQRRGDIKRLLEEASESVGVEQRVPQAIPPAATSTEDQAAPAAEGNGSAKSGLTKTRILLVEDDEDVRAILAMVLEGEMYEVVEAGNGREALDAVYNGPPDLVLCDLMMPVMDGREFLSKMHTNSATKEIPVIILTAVDSEDNEVSLLELGARDFVSKASSSDVMLSRIRRVLKT